MRRISEISVSTRLYFLVIVLFLAGCSLEKESAVNRGLQNLTAHYNILFNANELLRQKQDAYALSFVDAYNELLSVYQDTSAQGAGPDKDLEEVKVKGNKIINIKEQSHYLGDAYLVIGKADYLEGDYYDAVEFFSYVTRSYADNHNLSQEALVWKARTFIYLKQLLQAKLAIDSAIRNINPKKKGNIADIYATKMQYDIDIQDYVDAEASGKLAVEHCKSTNQRLRWMFILGQLQELNGKIPDAIKNYTRIANSNAAFEMAFNADLNRIRIQDSENGVKISRIDRLKSLLKNDNNKDFTDQIYYQIAEIYYSNKDIDNAIKYYHLSTRYSRKNLNQKGLSYLRIADIDFKIKSDYVAAKKYYDSTLLSLSVNYPGYQTIQKKANNLQLLADRYSIISTEDTLQMLAKLDDKARAAKIDAMVNRQILQQKADDANNGANDAFGGGSQLGGGSGSSSFYFYNTTAISQGFVDFKKRWGNRKLEDNWRRSNRNSSDITNNTSQTIDPDASTDEAIKGKSTSAGSYRQQLTKNLPLTPALLVQSNTKIYNAYFDIANFYRDILGDKKEAISIYELLLARFPNTPEKPALYYNLFRLYADIDPAKSEEYKNLLIKNYPETPFAKVIIDPEYGKKLNDADAGLNSLYNQVYEDYSKKNYKKVISGIDEVNNQYPNNKLSSQLAYLRAIAAGHIEKLAPFRTDLMQIVSKYPNDRLVTPLVKLHLTFVDAHQAEMSAQEFALMDNDATEVPFKLTTTEQDQKAQIDAYNNSQLVKQVAQKRVEPNKVPEKPPIVTPPVNSPVAVTKPKTDSLKQTIKASDITNQAAAKPPVVNAADSTKQVAPPVKKPSVPSIFSMKDSTNYYFVVNVTGAGILASSRFGIGQFNRANYENVVITHQVVAIGDDNQLIYVGRFYSLESAKVYARAIIPLMPDIMKVPKEQYSFFIITKENLDKLNTKKLLDSYIDYYQNNY